MNEELFNEASRSNVLSKKLVDQLQESMSYSSISFINWTIEVLKLLKARIERGDKLTDETTGVTYDLQSFRKFVEDNFSDYITGQVFAVSFRAQKVYSSPSCHSRNSSGSGSRPSDSVIIRRVVSFHGSCTNSRPTHWS